MRDTWFGAVIACALVVGLVAGFAIGISVNARLRHTSHRTRRAVR